MVRQPSFPVTHRRATSVKAHLDFGTNPDPFQGIGVALTALRRLTTLSASTAQRRLLVTLEIPSKDRSYPWFLEWMATQRSLAPASPGLRSMWKGKGPMTLRSHELAVETSYKQHENGSSEAVFNLVPGPGTHYFRYKGAWFQVSQPVEWVWQC